MKLRTWFVLVATLLLWSGNWIVARAVREEISPGLATVGRLIVVLAILLPFAWRGLADKLPALGRREWLVLAALGFTGGGPHLGLQWLGLHYTTAASGILYLSTTPIFILLLTAAPRLCGMELCGDASRRRARRRDTASHARVRRAALDALPRRIPALVSLRRHGADPRRGVHSFIGCQ